MPTRPPVHRPAGWRPPAEVKRAADRFRGTSTERGYGADWRRCREGFLQANPLCRFCEAAGLVVAADEVDHIRTIAEAPDLRLDWSNLRALCRPCHSRRTALEQSFGRNGAGRPDWLRPASIPVTIVCGAPGSGKTTYARQHATPRDLVIDLDHIASEMSGSTMHTWDRARWLGPALHARNEMLAGLATTRTGWDAAWLIVGEPDAIWRQWWNDKLRPTRIVVLLTDMDTCLDRIRADPERAAMRATAERGAREWFVRYSARAGDVVLREGQDGPKPCD